MKPKLDAHSEAILEEYRNNLPLFNETAGKVTAQIKEMLSNAGIIVAALESRVKTEGSLADKLELKGSKYASLTDITDILGLRVITFYIDDVDKVASGIERYFEVDWEDSVDKRKLHEIDSFGYLSLHYICRCEAMPYRFEVQIRTVLQHAWANMNHDTGYKSGVEVPREHLRNLNAEAQKRGETLAEMALAWILAQQGVTSVLVGASSTAQLEKNLRCIDAKPF